MATKAAEQDPAASPHAFGRREGPPSDILSHHGRASQVGHTGMSWSGFRPSDDACQYHYLVPANMLAVVALARLAALPLCDAVLAARARALASDIRAGIAAHGVVDHPGFGTIYAYEVDGLGHHTLMDDANVPSLLAAPYLGFCRVDDPVYRATRAFVLSEGNLFFTPKRPPPAPHSLTAGRCRAFRKPTGPRSECWARRGCWLISDTAPWPGNFPAGMAAWFPATVSRRRW